MGITLTQSDWIALSAMIVAVFALFVTIWDSYQSREHNRLSVKPFLGIYIYMDVSRLHRHSTTSARYS